MSDMAGSSSQKSRADSYLLADSDFAVERARLRALELAYDPATIARLNLLGVRPGMRCLEIGAGCGSIASWLANRVGAEGHVVATDIDPRFLTDLADGVEVVRHDITSDPLEPGSFDLIHVRIVLMHVPDAAAVVERIVDALAPGGYLLAEEADFSVGQDPGVSRLAELDRKFMDGAIRAGRSLGADWTLGARIAEMLQSSGLEGVAGDGSCRFQRCGPERTDLVSIEELGPAAIASGAITSAELAELAELLENSDAFRMTPLIVGAWGRTPD